MQSKLNIRQDVKSGKLSANEAVEQLKKIPGGVDTQTYRRIITLLRNR